MDNHIHPKTSSFGNLPIGLIGSTLGLVILANIYGAIGLKPVQFILMIIGSFILILGVFKFIFFPKKVFEDVTKPQLYSTYIAFPMAVMTVAKFYSQYNLIFSKVLWDIGACLDIFIVLTFLFLYAIKKPKLENISPSWFILLVGSVVIPVSNFNPDLLLFGRTIWILCFIAYIIILPMVAYRCMKLHLPTDIYPYYGITAAPASLLIVGYFEIATPNTQFLSCMVLVAIIMTLFAYAKMPKVFFSKFKPSFAGFTFALSISSLAEFKASAYYNKINYNQIALILRSLAYLELLIATIAIFSILIMFLIQFFKSTSKC